MTKQECIDKISKLSEDIDTVVFRYNIINKNKVIIKQETFNMLAEAKSALITINTTLKNMDLETIQEFLDISLPDIYTMESSLNKQLSTSHKTIQAIFMEK